MAVLVAARLVAPQPSAGTINMVSPVRTSRSMSAGQTGPPPVCSAAGGGPHHCRPCCFRSQAPAGGPLLGCRRPAGESGWPVPADISVDAQVAGPPVAAGCVAGTFVAVPDDLLTDCLVEGLSLHAGSSQVSDDPMLLDVAAEVLLQDPSSRPEPCAALISNEALPACTAAKLATRSGTGFEQMAAYLRRSDADSGVFCRFVADAGAAYDRMLSVLVESTAWDSLAVGFAAEAYEALAATGLPHLSRSLVRSPGTPTAVRLVAAKSVFAASDEAGLDALGEDVWSGLAGDLRVHADLFEHVPCSGLRRLAVCAAWDGLVPEQLEVLVDDVAAVVDGFGTDQDSDPPPHEDGFVKHTDLLLGHPALRQPVLQRLVAALLRLPAGSCSAAKYVVGGDWTRPAWGSLDGPCLLSCGYNDLAGFVSDELCDLRRFRVVLANPACDLPLLRLLLRKFAAEGWPLGDLGPYARIGSAPTKFRDMLVSRVSTVSEFVAVSLLFCECTGETLLPHSVFDLVASSSEDDLVEALRAARPMPRLHVLLQKRVAADAPWLLTDRVLAEFDCSACFSAPPAAPFLHGRFLLRFLRGRFSGHMPYWRMFFELMPAPGSLGEAADMVLAVESPPSVRPG